jgi:integrase
MRWSSINAGGLLTVKQGKTGKSLLIPIHRDLKVILDTIPKRAVTILTNTDGRPWKTGFTAAWNKNKPGCVKAAGLVFHGLRKSAVVTLLEAGCTDGEVAAITGQSRQMVEHYAKTVNQEKMAKSAMTRWEGSR